MLYVFCLQLTVKTSGTALEDTFVHVVSAVFIGKSLAKVYSTGKFLHVDNILALVSHVYISKQLSCYILFIPKLVSIIEVKMIVHYANFILSNAHKYIEQNFW